MGRIRIDLVYRHLDLSVLFDDDGEPLEIQTYTGRRTVNDQPVYESIGDIFSAEAWADIVYEATQIMNAPSEPEPYEW